MVNWSTLNYLVNWPSLMSAVRVANSGPWQTFCIQHRCKLLCCGCNLRSIGRWQWSPHGRRCKTGGGFCGPQNSAKFPKILPSQNFVFSAVKRPEDSEERKKAQTHELFTKDKAFATENFQSKDSGASSKPRIFAYLHYRNAWKSMNKRENVWKFNRKR